MLTTDQLDRLRRCADGNTLRFESADIVAVLVAGGYVKEGIGRVVTVTPKGQQYLRAHAMSQDVVQFHIPALGADRSV